MTKIRLGAVLPLSALVLVLACSSDPESTTPKAGESCSGAGTGACNDPKSALFCKDGVWTLAPCNGAEGCNDSGDKIVCDFTMGKEGDVCIIAEGAAANACSLDGTKTLKCQDNKWVPEVDCSGPNKCRVEGKAAKCDQTLGNLDAACLTEGQYACAVDGTKLLACKGGKFVIEEECTGGQTCKVTAMGAGCLP